MGEPSNGKSLGIWDCIYTTTTTARRTAPSADAVGEGSDSFYAILQKVAQEHDRIVKIWRERLDDSSKRLDDSSEYQRLPSPDNGLIIASSNDLQRIHVASANPHQASLASIAESKTTLKTQCNEADRSWSNGQHNFLLVGGLLERAKEFVVNARSRSNSNLGNFRSPIAEFRGWMATPVERQESWEFDPLNTHLAAITSNGLFDTACAMMTCGNLVYLGILNDSVAKGSKFEEGPILVTNLVFSLFFLMELLMRVFSFGPTTFFCHSRKCRWNIFDSLVMVSDIPEMLLYVFRWGSPTGRLPLIRIVRVLRIVRVARIARLVRELTQLRLMLKSIFMSLGTVGWSAAVFGTVTYLFSVGLMLTVTDHRFDDAIEKDPGDEALLDSRFGSTVKTMQTLFFSVSGGLDWAEHGIILFKIGAGSGLIMCTYVFFMVFAMMNIVTGIFVESVMESLQNDREEVTRLEMRTENSTFKKLYAVFLKADRHNSGTMNFDEFQAMVEDTQTAALLRSLGLEVYEARGLFKLIDSDDSGQVNLEEFLVACIKLKGGAKAVDLATIMYENRKMQKFFRMETKQIKAKINSLEMFFYPTLSPRTTPQSPVPQEKSSKIEDSQSGCRVESEDRKPIGIAPVAL